MIKRPSEILRKVFGVEHPEMEESKRLRQEALEKFVEQIQDAKTQITVRRPNLHAVK